MRKSRRTLVESVATSLSVPSQQRTMFLGMGKHSLVCAARPHPAELSTLAAGPEVLLEEVLDQPVDLRPAEAVAAALDHVQRRVRAGLLQRLVQCLALAEGHGLVLVAV